MKRMHVNKWTLALAACGAISLAPAARADAGTNAPTTESGTAIGSKSSEGFWKRLDEAWLEQLGTASNPVVTNAPPTPRRGNDAPFDSPPLFNGEWQIGGTETIGSQNLTPDSPLMEAIYQGPWGKAWASTKVKIYGWVDVSGNLSTSQKPGEFNGQSANYPVIYPQRSDRVELDQAVVYIERTPDEYQTDHIDWGFRISSVYGLDYRYMIADGLWSGQLLNHNHYYGFDMPMIYANLYIPWVLEGMNITAGRIISEADIEAQLAPNNPMSTHSLLYSYDPYTQVGVFTTTKVNRNWTLQAGISAGNDIMPWMNHNPGDQPTASLMFQYQSSDNRFSFYGGANALNNAEFGYNNIQQYVGTFSYKITSKIWTTQETWYMFQEGYNPKNPADQGPVNASDPEIRPAASPGQPGYGPGAGVLLPGYSYEWATLNYTMFRLAPNTFFTVRAEMFDDARGQRTGYDTVYQEDSIGITYWPDEIITIRPELRYDHSFREAVYDLGSRHNQLMASFDVIVHF